MWEGAFIKQAKRKEKNICPSFFRTLDIRQNNFASCFSFFWFATYCCSPFSFHVDNDWWKREISQIRRNKKDPSFFVWSTTPLSTTAPHITKTSGNPAKILVVGGFPPAFSDKCGRRRRRKWFSHKKVSKDFSAEAIEASLLFIFRGLGNPSMLLRIIFFSCTYLWAAAGVEQRGRGPLRSLLHSSCNIIVSDAQFFPFRKIVNPSSQ